jgi:hypothetical protein
MSEERAALHAGDSSPFRSYRFSNIREVGFVNLSVPSLKFRLWLKTQTKYLSSYAVLEYDDEAYIELLESFPCANKDELRKREHYHIEQHACVNKNRAYLDPEKIVEIRARQQAKYYQDHAEQRSVYGKEYREARPDMEKNYREANKARIREKRQAYYLANKEVLLAKGAAFRAANPDYNREAREAKYEEKNAKRREVPSVVCQCGSTVRPQCLKRHLASPLHLAFLAKEAASVGQVPVCPVDLVELECSVHGHA